MEIINNFDQLFGHLAAAYDSYTYCCGGHIQFQGNLCEVGGVMPEWTGNFYMNPKYPMTVFLVGADYKDDEGQYRFNLYIFKGSQFVLDQTLCVALPLYVKDELVFTLMHGR